LDIPNTVAKVSAQAARLGVEMFTLHLSGGRKMIQAVRDELSAFPKKPKILGVTVLTSFAESEFNEVLHAYSDGPLRSIQDSVVALAERAQSWGCDGIVCSPQELKFVTSGGLSSLYKVVPGIRPQGSEIGDQARVMTPKQAALAGAGAIVVGRPITRAGDPVAVLGQISNELKL
jgi:orotidine-5'-phosphate decarboxylase